jgi:Ca-activated chloride channel family protein
MYLWFFMAVPAVLIVHYISIRKVKRKAILFANYEAMEKVYGTKILSKNYPLLLIRVLTLVFLVFAIAGTVLIYEGQVSDFDFALAIDSSASMLAQDYQPDRLAAAKDAATLFAESVPEGTKIGVVSFAGAGFVKQELTDDMDKVKAAISGVDIELAGGTAVGEAIMSSANLLTQGRKNRVIVLLTDGQNNVGIDVDDAIKYARDFHVIIHTIGIGTEEGGIVANASFVVGLDAETLESISAQTGGRYFGVMDAQELESAYRTIATISRQDIELDLSSYLMLIAVGLFILELVMVNSKYRTIP